MSRVRVRAEVTKPEEMEISMTLTMNVRDWRLVCEQLRSVPNLPFPSWRLADAIQATVMLLEGRGGSLGGI